MIDRQYVIGQSRPSASNTWRCMRSNPMARPAMKLAPARCASVGKVDLHGCAGQKAREMPGQGAGIERGSCLGNQSHRKVLRWFAKEGSQQSDMAVAAAQQKQAPFGHVRPGPSG